MKKLVSRRVTACYTPEAHQANLDALRAFEARIMAPPSMSDDEFNALPKMGDIKRTEIGEKAVIFNDHNSFLSPAASPAFTNAELMLFDQANEYDKIWERISKKIWRSADIAGYQAINRVALSEERALLAATEDDADGVEAVNKLNRLKKAKVSNNDKATTPKTDEPKK